MEAKHKPATPLPWDRRSVGLHDRHGELAEVEPNIAQYVLFQDAAYIAHAANAYPKLVAALREMTQPYAAVAGTNALEEAIGLLREIGEAE